MKPAIIHRTIQAELTPSETLYTDSIDYLLGGALTLRNGRIDKFQFDEGYCQAEEYTSTKDVFTFCYYDKDHLGNVRQVTELDGTSKGDVIQKCDKGRFCVTIRNGGNHTGASHQPVGEGWTEGNMTLKKMIIDSKKETIKNMN